MAGKNSSFKRIPNQTISLEGLHLPGSLLLMVEKRLFSVYAMFSKGRQAQEEILKLNLVIQLKPTTHPQKV